MTALALSFREIQFDVVDRAGQPWLRSQQISVALGYSRPDALNKLYQSNASEFTDHMTALITLPDLQHRFDGAASSAKLTDQTGQAREVRIFSLRGCHLLAMFARTSVAAEFRRWVLDILDREVESQLPRRALSTGLQQRINQRAWILAQGTFDGFRVQMRDAARHDPDFEPERWTPLQSQRQALQGVAAMAGLLEATANLLRERGRELGQRFGEDFDGITRQIS